MAMIDQKVDYGMSALGIAGIRFAYRNLSVAALCEHVARRNEGLLSEHGALVVQTGKHTGRQLNK